MSGIAFIALTVATLIQLSSAQIPTACTDASSLENLICCPATEDGVCGQDASRGSCMPLDFENYDNETSNVRVNWPHYYTQVCQCNGNFGGYDCSRCKFGYYGSDCSQFQVLPRPPLRNFTDEDWTELISILRMTRTYDSGYSAVLEESAPGNSSIVTVPLSLYEYYVWVHHYTAKDTVFDAVRPIDYSHNGPAFFTWHRHFNLILEQQIQRMLQEMGRSDYHMFRLPYWDWRIEMQNSSIGINSDTLFSETRLGTTRNVSGLPRVFGGVAEGGWDTICWPISSQICDPRVDTGPLQRCPFTGNDPCSSSNPGWPSQQDVQNALDHEVYDAAPYNFLTADGFRAFADAIISGDIEACREHPYCICFPGGPACPPIEGATIQTAIFELHTRVHIILGIGSANDFLTIPLKAQGQIVDVGASPNDPIFIFHHTMVDCVLEEWMRGHPDGQYPADPEVREGQRIDDFVNGFFPLYTHREMFVAPGEEFGYTCRLADIPDDAVHFISSPLLMLLSMLTVVVTTRRLSN